MKPSEEIRAQREFLLANKWVKGSPVTYPPDNMLVGCLVIRSTGNFSRAVCLDGLKYIEDAVVALHPDFDTGAGFRVSPATSPAILWNDEAAKSLDEVIEVLNYAEKLALIDEESDAQSM